MCLKILIAIEAKSLAMAKIEYLTSSILTLRFGCQGPPTTPTHGMPEYAKPPSFEHEFAMTLNFENIQ